MGELEVLRWFQKGVIAMDTHQDYAALRIISSEVRRRVFSTILAAGSGHLGGSSSSVELMVALYFGGILHSNPLLPQDPARDRVLVRGHLGPLRYSIFSLLGWIEEKELTTYRGLGSRLQGHECMHLVPGVDITPSGMLGMLLSYGVGSAYALRTRQLPATTWVFLGDGEEQEGNVSEAARHAAHLRLSNLVCVVDQNGKQLSHPTKGVDAGTDLATVWRGYGWNVRHIADGHDLEEIVTALRAERPNQQPTVFIAKTVKGYGIDGCEKHHSGFHTLSCCSRDVVEEAQRSLWVDPAELESALRFCRDRTPPPRLTRTIDRSLSFPEIPCDDEETIEDVLVRYLRNVLPWVRDQGVVPYVLTADVTVPELAVRSGFTLPGVQFIDVGIREQHMLGMTHGIAVTDPRSLVMVIDGDPFLFRAADQLHALAQARTPVVILGTDSGLCEARNGATHQTESQPSALLTMPGLTVLEPADGVDLVQCLAWAFTQRDGPVYLRLHSGPQGVLPTARDARSRESYLAFVPKVPIRLTVVASGLPTHMAIELATRWEERGVGISVINVINIAHPGETFPSMLTPGVPLLTVYNGHPAVLQGTVARCILEHQCPHPSVVRGHGFVLGTSGTLTSLLRHFRQDTDGIEEVVREMFPDVLPA